MAADMKWSYYELCLHGVSALCTLLGKEQMLSFASIFIEYDLSSETVSP